MKVLSTDGLTKLIQLIKSAFISVDDTVTTSTIDLADVATTGDYDDLINKPTIPSAVTESTVSDWGFTKNIGTVTSVNNVAPVNGNVTLSIPQQVQANWSETDTTSKAYIQNKPSIPTVNQSFDGTSTNAESGVSILGLLQAIYPVGSVYLSTNSTCPLANYFGTWSLVSSGRALWTGYGSNGGSTISAGLPDISGTLTGARINRGAAKGTGAFSGLTISGKTGGYDGSTYCTNSTLPFNASNSNSIYGNSTTVQPPAYVVNVWRRTA